MENVVNINNNVIDLVDIKKASELTGLKYSLLYKIIVRTNQVPFHKFGHKNMVSLKRLQQYIKQCYVPTYGGQNAS